ncbi:DNA polymerase III subunit beta [Leptolyngbya sp. AN03gr2]|uniref:DNA polymerase III subunit beta n=1 Tax=unclassified Leptolyngbya TaxID=2650499 RepID=UPI003D30F7CB
MTQTTKRKSTKSTTAKTKPAEVETPVVETQPAPLEGRLATVQQATLSELTQLVVKAVPSQGTNPELKYLVIEACVDTQQLFLQGFDLKIGMRVCLPANVSQSGKLLVPPLQFSNLIEKMPKTAITLEAAPGTTQLRLLSAIAQSEIPAKPATHYPKLPEPDGTIELYELNAREFQRAIRAIAMCASKDESQAPHHGVQIQLWKQSEQTCFSLCAADGHVLGLYQTTTPEQEVPDFDCIVRADALTKLSELLDLNVSDTVAIELEKSEQATNSIIRFRYGENSAYHCMTVRVLEGNFSNYRNILSNLRQQVQTTVTIDQSQLISCLDRHLVMVTSINTRVVKFTATSTGLDTESKSANGGHCESISGQINGSSLTTHLNAANLQRTIQKLNHTEAKLQIIGEKSPLLISAPESTADQLSLTFLLMPVEI